MVDEQMVVPAIKEVAEPVAEAEDEQVIAPAVDMEEGQMDVPVTDMEEDLAVLFGDDDFEDDASDGFGEEEVWEVNEDWLMAPTTPHPMLVVPPPSVIGCRSIYLRFQRTVLIPSTPALGLLVPPFVIEDLSIHLGNLEYEHGQLVKKVMASQMIHVVDIVEQVGAQVEQGQQIVAQRDETIDELTQQVQALQIDVQQRDTQIQRLQTTVTEMGNRESTLMRCILGLERRIAALEKTIRTPIILTKIPKWVEAELVSPEVESEKWRRLLLHSMSVAFYVSTDGREEDFFPRNGMLGIVDGLDGTERGYQGRCLGEYIMGEPLSPDRVFDFLIDELEPHPAYDFFAPAPLPGYAGNPDNYNVWLKADDCLLGELEEMVDKHMVVPAIEEINALVMDIKEDLAALFGNDDLKDDASDGFGEEEVWEVNDDWLMAPTTPYPMLAVPPPSVYKVGGPSSTVAEGPSFPQNGYLANEGQNTTVYSSAPIHVNVLVASS
ncbi:hypothetical protein Tco_0011539 [Tanacetum coccineum]